jgi:hypothetical protein
MQEQFALLECTFSGNSGRFAHGFDSRGALG